MTSKSSKVAVRDSSIRRRTTVLLIQELPREMVLKLENTKHAKNLENRCECESNVKSNKAKIPFKCNPRKVKLREFRNQMSRELNQGPLAYKTSVILDTGVYLYIIFTVVATDKGY